MQEEIADTIIRRIRTFYSAYLERILKAAKGNIYIVLTGGDFGSQTGLLISPITWRRFLKDGFRQYIELIKSSGSTAMHHTAARPLQFFPT